MYNELNRNTLEQIDDAINLVRLIRSDDRISDADVPLVVETFNTTRLIKTLLQMNEVLDQLDTTLLGK